MRQLAALALALALLGSLALTGCSLLDPEQHGSEPSSGPGGRAAADASGEQRAREPAGQHAEMSRADPALDAFRSALDGHSPHDPGALVDAVEAAGYDRASIERTREVDSLGAPVTFLEIAVPDAGSCLVGQVGDGEPLAVRTGALGGGRCLVGETVTVD